MTTVNTPPDHQAHALSELLARLARLDGLLRQEGFAHGPDRWLNLQDLLLRMAQEGRLPADPAALRPLMAPLFCRTPDEQRRFAELFQRWVAGDRPQQPKYEKPSAPPIARQEEKSYRVSFRFLVAAALVIILGVGVLAYNFMPPDQPKQETERLVQPPTSAIEKHQIDEKEPALSLPLQAIPPRQPPEPEQQNAQHRRWLGAIKWSLITAPGVLVLAALLWRWWRRQIVLRRHRATGDDPISTIRLDIQNSDLFDGPAVRASLRRLHTPVARPTRHLHEPATIAATIQQGGLFQPVYRDRLEVPEIVVLVQMRHRSDPVTGLAEALIARLRDADLLVTPFYYQVDPRRLFNHALGLRARLSDLAGKHRGARLLIVGDPEAFVDILHNELHAWTELFERWPDRGLLYTEERGASQDRLQESGFLLFPLSSDGIVMLGSRLTAATPESLIPESQQGLQQPPALFSDGNVWSQSQPPPGFDQNRLFQELQDYLGGPGLLLLSAMAAYPHLHWGLTRILDLSFMPGSASARPHEARMLKLAVLPWGRRGWIPDWLRTLLLEQLSNRQRQRIRQLYADLFEKLQNQDPRGVAVPLAAKPKGRLFWAYLGDIFSRAPENSALRDRIFASLLLGRGLKLLDFELPKAAAALLPGMRWIPALLPALVLLLLGSGGCWLSYWGWNQGAEQWVQQPLLAWQRNRHAAIEVRILALPKTDDLANRLATTLKAHGFKQAEIRRLQQLEEDELEIANTTSYGTDVNPNFARYLTRRIAHLTYQQPSELLQNTPLDAGLPAKLIQVRLTQPPEGGGTFQDALNRRLSADEWQRILQSLRPKDQAVQPLQEAEAEPSFIEPEMVEIPGGRFQMGCVSGSQECASDELPVHEVRIQPFLIGRHEVTFDEYDRFTEATDREKPDDEGWGREKRPVINVSWEDAMAYAEWLSQQSGVTYRLPTEAEWEYAVRAGTQTSHFWGENPDQACQYANVYDLTAEKILKYGYTRHDCDDGEAYNTAPVGRYGANPFGLNDMLGNVWEWTADCWHKNYDRAPTDGSAWEQADDGDCVGRVVRGGGWDYLPGSVRSADRFRGYRDVASYMLGFRLARDK